MSDIIAQAKTLLAQITPGPWAWFGNRKAGGPYLATIDRGREFVMKFCRSGMSGAQPVFLDHETQMMVPAWDLAIYEVCPAATDESDPRLYRHDIIGFRNPEAEFIAAAPTIVAALLAEVERLRALVGGVTR